MSFKIYPILYRDPAAETDEAATDTADDQDRENAPNGAYPQNQEGANARWC